MCLRIVLIVIKMAIIVIIVIVIVEQVMNKVRNRMAETRKKTLKIKNSKRRNSSIMRNGDIISILFFLIKSIQNFFKLKLIPIRN